MGLSPGSFRSRGVGALLLAALLSTASGCRAPAIERPSGPAVVEPDSLFYAFGDIGTPGEHLRSVAGAMASRRRFDRALLSLDPPILALGDNLYTHGLPRDPKNDPAPVERLRAIADDTAGLTRGERPSRLTLIPGNHDYDALALESERETGNLALWYFLDELDPERFRGWRHAPGRPTAADTDAETLRRRLARSIRTRAEFMAPMRIPSGGPSMAVIAIDTELLIELHDRGEDAIRRRYLEQLEARLAVIPKGVWRIVTGHHPIETYGKHRPGQLWRFVFGPGWPQLWETWHKVALLPPLGFLATFTWWAVHHPQDVHSAAEQALGDDLAAIFREQNVALYLAGHDHNSQLIDLAVSRGDGTETLVVVSGAGAKRDPVSTGPGTELAAWGPGWVRIAADRRALAVEFINHRNETLWRRTLRKRDP